MKNLWTRITFRLPRPTFVEHSHGESYEYGGWCPICEGHDADLAIMEDFNSQPLRERVRSMLAWKVGKLALRVARAIPRKRAPGPQEYDPFAE